MKKINKQCRGIKHVNAQAMHHSIFGCSDDKTEGLEFIGRQSTWKTWQQMLST